MAAGSYVLHWSSRATRALAASVVVLLVGAGTGAVALDQGSSSIDVRAAEPDVADGSEAPSPELAEPYLVPLPEPTLVVVDDPGGS